MSKFASKVGKLTLAELLRLPSVKMPIFQRQYSWDVKNKKALAYVFDFLASSDNTHLDYILTYATQPLGSKSSDFIDFQDLHCVPRLFLADGQHRLVTALMAVHALVDFLNQPGQAAIRQNLQQEIEYFSELLSTAEIEVVLQPCKSASLKDLLHSFAKTLQDQNCADLELKAEIARKREDVKTLSKPERKPERSRLRDELTRGLAATQAVRDTVLDSSVWQSYVAIQSKFEELAKEDVFKFGRLVMSLQRRFEEVSATLDVFMPNQSGVTVAALTTYCFNLFTAKNGHSSPLTAEDLFIAYAGDKSECDYPAIAQLIEGKTVANHPAITSAFGIEGISTFFAARAIWDNQAYKEDARLGQIQEAFFSTTERAAESLAHYNDVLTKTQASSVWFRAPHISATLQNYFQIYHDALAQNATFVLKLRFVKEIIESKGKPSEAQMVMLYKTLLLLEVTQYHYEPNHSRASLARDVPRMEAPVLSNALRYCMNHFNATTVEQFKSKLRHHLQSFPFGNGARDLGKVLLFTAEYNPGRAIPFSESVYKTIAYEHVLPVNFEDAPLDDDEMSELKKTLAVSSDSSAMEGEISATLNLLGNAALLQRSANSELQDALPHKKLAITETKKLGSSWSSGSLQDLRTAQTAPDTENWDGDYIRRRSAVLADNLVSFLLDDAMLQLL
jgi:hypothetical protein